MIGFKIYIHYQKIFDYICKWKRGIPTIFKIFMYNLKIIQILVNRRKIGLLIKEKLAHVLLPFASACSCEQILHLLKYKSYKFLFRNYVQLF